MSFICKWYLAHIARSASETSEENAHRVAEKRNLSRRFRCSHVRLSRPIDGESVKTHLHYKSGDAKWANFWQWSNRRDAT